MEISNNHQLIKGCLFQTYRRRTGGRIIQPSKTWIFTP